jgi:hypothetical protein
MILVAALSIIGLAPAADAPVVGAMLDRMEEAYAAVRSYTARFVRQERVGDVIRPREEALVKFQRPGRLYLRWVSGPPTGRELLFVEGRDDDSVLVHEPSGIARLFTIVLAPDSPRVLRESRHPITDIGLGPLIELITRNARRALGQGELKTVDQGTATAIESGRPERRLELILPRDPGKGYYCHRVLVAVDATWGLPVEVMIFDWHDRLVATYAYRKLELNADLTALDFDPGNPEYRFPRWRVRW